MVGMNMRDKEQGALLSILRMALWGGSESLPDADWAAVGKLAREQGVLWMLYLGTRRCAEKIPKELFRKWRAAAHSSVLRGEKVSAIQSMLLSWIYEQGMRAAILKGTSCSRYYPVPKARVLGDVDVLVDEENMDKIGNYLKQQGFEAHREPHEFHVGYYRGDDIIEVHYAATNVPPVGGGRVVRETMPHFLDEIVPVEYDDVQFWALSERYQALMLLLHMERHMLAGGIGLRQMCDWAVFVNGSDPAHWKNGTLDLLESCGLLVYAKVVTKTCMDYLGLKQDCAQWALDINEDLSEAMIKDVFRGGNLGFSDTNGAGSLFTSRDALGQKNQSRLRGLLITLTKLSYQHFPFTQRCKFLLPAFWIYLPLRYWLRSMLGLRPKKEIAHVLNSSSQRQKLYKELKLYITEE